MQRGPVMSAPVSVVVNGSPVPLKVTAEVGVVAAPSPSPTSSPSTPLPHVVRVSVVSPPAAVSPQSPQPATEADERSSSGASSGTGSDDEAPYDSDSGAEMKFHLRELEDNASSSPPPDGVSVGRPLDADKAILSRQGTVRGVRNLVRASIKCIADCQEGKVSWRRPPCASSCCGWDDSAAVYFHRPLCILPGGRGYSPDKSHNIYERSFLTSWCTSG